MQITLFRIFWNTNPDSMDLNKNLEIFAKFWFLRPTSWLSGSWMTRPDRKIRKSVLIHMDWSGYDSNHGYYWAHEEIGLFHSDSETHSCLWYCRFIINEGGEKMRPRLLNNEKRRRRRIRTLWCSGKMNLTHEVLKITRYRHPNYIIWAISILKLCKHQKYPCGAILLGWESESVGFGLTVWDGDILVEVRTRWDDVKSSHLRTVVKFWKNPLESDDLRQEARKSTDLVQFIHRMAICSNEKRLRFRWAYTKLKNHVVPFQ